MHYKYHINQITVINKDQTTIIKTMHICTIDKCKNTAQIKLVQVIIF